VIDWEKSQPIAADMYVNHSENGGRPNYDEILMVNLLVLQAWHGLSDPELERRVADRISFMKFLGFPETENALIGQVKMMKSGMNCKDNYMRII